VVGAPNWDSPRTAQLARTACMDCHSNETVWPWYSNVAPMSWLVQKDVDEARREFNLSDPREWRNRGRQAAFQVQRGTMPMPQYTLIHCDASLSPADRQALADGLVKSLGSG
jgi:hypothetical protein